MPRRAGFTVTELVVSMAVLGLLLALLLPAVQVAREAARRSQCISNLHQIGIALHNYESLHGMFPAGCFQAQTSWEVAILPQIDRLALFQQVNFAYVGNPYPADPIADVAIPIYLCPSDPAPAISSSNVAATNYMGNSGTGIQVHGFDGMFSHGFTTRPQYPEGWVRLASVTDGLTSTAAVAEVLHSDVNSSERLRVSWNTPSTTADVAQFRATCSGIPQDPAASGWHGNRNAHGWQWVRGEIGWAMYNHMLPPFQPSCFNGTSVQDGIYSVASAHQTLTNVLFADGHVQAVSANIDSKVWAALGSRNGSEPVQY